AASVKAISAGAAAKLEPLKSGDVQLFEMGNNVWRCTVPAGVTPQQLDLHESYWSALADDLREGDEIKALAQDRAWIARFEVVDSVAGRVIVRLAQVIEGAPRLSAAGAPRPLPEGYRVERLKPGDRR